MISEFNSLQSENGNAVIGSMILSVDKKIEEFKKDLIDDESERENNPFIAIATESDSNVDTVSETGDTTELESE